MIVSIVLCIIRLIILRTLSHIGDKDNLRPTMATSYGKLDEFNPTLGEDWIQYIKWMEYYFLANGITYTNKQRAVLISVMGAKAYKTLWNLITLHNLSDKSFTELVEFMTKYFFSPPSEIVQRFKFNTRARKPGESVANYIAEL